MAHHLVHLFNEESSCFKENPLTTNLSLFCQSLLACQSHPRSAPAVSQRWCIHKYRSPAKSGENHGLKKTAFCGGIDVLLTMLKHMPAISQSFLLKNLKTKKGSLDQLPLEKYWREWKILATCAFWTSPCSSSLPF